MSCHAGPDIVENGLVFCYDMNNTQKSWRGKPTTNMLGNPTCLNNTGPTSVYYSGYEASVEIVSALNTQMYLISPYWIKYTKNSNSNGRIWFLGVSGLTIDTDYTYSVYIYTDDSRVTGFNLGSDNGAVSNTTNVLSSWSSSDINRVKRISATFRSLTGSQVQGCRISFSDPIGATFYMTGFQCEQQSIATPIVSGTRSNTQAIIDLTGNNIITASNLTYNSDGSFDFNYANSSTIQIPLSTAFNKLEGTINVWIYPTRYNGANGIFSNRPDTNYNEGNWLWIGPYSGTFYFRLGDGSSCCSNDLSIANYQSYVPLNSWTNLCCTWKSANTSAIYINGQLNTSRSISTIPNTNPHSIGAFGVGHANADGYFHGKMPIGQIYNRQLSPSEVSQNFNAIRKRYGV